MAVHVYLLLFVLLQTNVLCAVGGHDSSGRTRCMLDKIMTTKLMTRYNYRGRGKSGKKAFSNLLPLPDLMLGKGVNFE